MAWTVFVRLDNLDHGGEADVASQAAVRGGVPCFVGCTYGEVDASPCVDSWTTDDPVASLVAHGVELVDKES